MPSRKGVLLFNLGGPETLADVRPFLYNLFSDREIIRIRSDRVRKTLAWLIAATRQRKSRELYRQIGGGSPLRKITEAQAAALQECLRSAGVDAQVYVGMRCWKPTIDNAVQQVVQNGITELVVLPLFPQYSVTTTGSCFSYFRELIAGCNSDVKISYIDSWFDQELYLESMADLIRDALKRFSDPNPANVQLLYSAHSIPARYVEEGDPYLAQTQTTVSLIDSRLGNTFRSSLAFQSKVGPVKWLAPSTVEVLEEFGRRKAAGVLVVPISFVSDHIETLQEIDIVYKQKAADCGIKEFHRAASLNLYPKFIQALAAIVQASMPRRSHHQDTKSTKDHQDR